MTKNERKNDDKVRNKRFSIKKSRVYGLEGDL